MARLNLATCGAELVVGGREVRITGDSTGPHGTQFKGSGTWKNRGAVSPQSFAALSSIILLL